MLRIHISLLYVPFIISPKTFYPDCFGCVLLASVLSAKQVVAGSTLRIFLAQVSIISGLFFLNLVKVVMMNLIYSTFLYAYQVLYACH